MQYPFKLGRFCFRSTAKIPLALSVCQESREGAKAHYQLWFCAEPWEYQAQREGGIYIDFSIDKLYIPRASFSVTGSVWINDFYSGMSNYELNKMRKLKVDGSQLFNYDEVFQLRNFGSLKELCIKFKSSLVMLHGPPHDVAEYWSQCKDELLRWFAGAKQLFSDWEIPRLTDYMNQGM